DRDPVLHANIYAEHRRLVLPRAVDRQYRDAAVEPAVAVERDRHLLEAVHAGNRDDAGQAAAIVARRQVEPGRERGLLERDPHRLDPAAGEPGVIAVAFALLLIAGDVGFVVLVIGPLRRAPVDGRHEPVVAGADETALGLGEARLVLAAAGGGGEG